MADPMISPTQRRMSDLRIQKAQSIDDGDQDTITFLKNTLSQHDVQVINQSISYMNPFLTRRSNDKQQLVFMREVQANGDITSLEMSLRALLGCVNNVADSIDAMENDGLEEKSFGNCSTAESLNKLGATVAANRSAKQSAAINLRVRDLRRLDFNFNPTEEPSIWVRRHAVMFSVDPIRAIIMGSRIVIVVPPGGMDQILEILEKYMRGSRSPSPYCHHYCKTHFFTDRVVFHAFYAYLIASKFCVSIFYFQLLLFLCVTLSL